MRFDCHDLRVGENDIVDLHMTVLEGEITHSPPTHGPRPCDIDPYDTYGSPAAKLCPCWELHCVPWSALNREERVLVGEDR